MYIRVVELVKKYQQVLRFLVTGGIAFSVNISVFFLSTDIAHVHYLLSTVFAFLASFMISFLMQKFWTFQDHSREEWHVQFSLYLALQLTNLVLNEGLLYAFVEYLGIRPVFSQAIIALGLAVTSFFVSKVYIFKTPRIVP